MNGPVVWEGIFSSFDEALKGAAAEKPNVFHSEIWLSKLSERLEQDLSRLAAPEALPDLAVTHEYPLPLLVALLSAGRRSVRVLDFGGGLASTYLAAIAVMPDSAGLEYHIVETQAVCAMGQEGLKRYSNVYFHEALPRLEGPVDVVLAASSLHYVEDWKGMLAKLAAYDPDYLLLADLPAGDIPTFVTSQNFHGSKMPVWMWNREEVVGVVEQFGFSLIYRARYVARIGGVAGPLPTKNLPQGHRLEYACHLMFRRNDGE